MTLVAALTLTAGGAVGQDFSFHDLTLSDEERVEIVLDQLTLDEKTGLLSTNLGVSRLGIADCGSMEGLHGLALGGPAANNGKKIVDGAEVADDRFTTIFPQAYGLGETWDPECVRRVGAQMAEEARYYYNSGKSNRRGLVVYAPNADLARDPRWGRTEESFGEDPYLTSEMVVAMVKGLQGDDPRYWKAASLMKHFLANSNEDGRDSTSSDFDTRLFREYYSYPFYKGLTAGGSRAFMASYNAWNGTPMCINPCLLEIAREEWGNNGIICTDGGGLRLLVESHHAFPSLAEGAAAIIKATTGQFLDDYKAAVDSALAKGLVTENDIDDAIRGNIFVALKLGLLDGEDSDNPYLEIGKDSTATPPYMKEEARQLAREITAKSIVLMKNDSLLPIDLSQTKKIAVIGPYADQIIYDWYSGTPAESVTILQGLREAVEGTGVEVCYAKDNSLGRAEALARDADIVIVCTGNHPYGTRAEWFFCPVPSDGREAVDRRLMSLPDEDLLRQLYAVNPNTVLVLVSSFPYTINWSVDNLPAILHVTHCSEEQGNAVADVLLGKVNPAGRTTQTWVRDILDLPEMLDYDIRHGRTYMYGEKEPLFPFGHGLSYTTFEYGKAEVSRDSGGDIEIAIEISNVGDRDGEEVVEVYASFPQSSGTMARKKLCAFNRIGIKAGETLWVRLRPSPEAMSMWNEEEGAFVMPEGNIVFLIGSSSEDIRQTCTLKELSLQ